MALQVAGMEKINSMDFCRAPVYRAIFFPYHQISNVLVENECNQWSPRVFEVKQRASSPRSQDIVTKWAGRPLCRVINWDIKLRYHLARFIVSCDKES